MPHAIYVEIEIRADLERVWRLTQDPLLHARWDARFSRITPEPGDRQPRRFTYERALPFHVIHGTGISIGERVGAASRTSALRFATTDPISPLQSGRGYWRYTEREGRVLFVTGYDYEPGRWALLDRLILRRIIGWMTAWSFDRLRIWAERDEPPERWPLRSVLALWRADRPRASRCVRRPRRGDAMRDAPASLDHLEAP